LRLYRKFILIASALWCFNCWGQDTLFVEEQSAEEQMIDVISDLEERIIELEEGKSGESDDFLNSLQFGLSFGFNYFTNAAQNYYVKEDSTIGVFGKSNGLSGMLSALLGYKISEKHSLLINIPLGDISGNPNQAIGVFNKRIAGGLGYGYNIDKLSVIAVINLYPYEEVALDVVKDKKFEQEPLTILDISNAPKQSSVSPSITVGICYNLFKPRAAIPISY
jgi:hypothetical protein